ncbi:MAG: penicillin acylase family protein [Alphaproteobacteria bacterium]|nr:penicillin acylase family protein [Alphaproteobacteria bacterium]
MPRWFTALFWAAIALGGVFVGLSSWDALIASAPPADPARKRNVTIARDQWGVPHISGKTDADVAYGIALAQSQDDFRNLEETLAAVRGRSAALLGEDGARLDFVGHLLDARAMADKGYASLSPATRALVEAYAQGLNDYARGHAREVRLQGLFPVNGRDVVAGFAMRSPFFFGLDRPLSALIEGKLPPRDAGPADERGSNAFAVAGRRSSDGVTRLIVNSHQPWEGPVTWWELVVHSDEGWDFAGANFPGAPYPLLGHNKHLGWANTVNRPDLIDVYRLVLDEGGTRYRLDGQWRDLESRRVWLRVKFGPLVLPIPRTVYRSVHGPVIINDLGAFAIRYAGIGQVGQVEQYYRLNKARDFAEWKAIMATQAVPATAFVYADAKGHIGMFYNALFPARAPGYDWKGVLPGDTSKTLWNRYLPWAGNPHTVDPAAGWVATANSTPFLSTAPADQLKRADFPVDMGIETYVTNRAQRYQARFAQLGNQLISRDQLLSIKFDKGYDRSGWAGRWWAEVLALDTRGRPDLQKARALIRQWDFTLDCNGPADGLVALAFAQHARFAYLQKPVPDARKGLEEAVQTLTRHFGTLAVPLGDFQRLRRGTVDLPLCGGPDTLRAVIGTLADDGRRVSNNGDGFIMLIEWDAAGQVQSRSIHQFGSAATRPQSPHYADQSPLFAAQRFKPVPFPAGGAG